MKRAVRGRSAGGRNSRGGPQRTLQFHPVETPGVETPLQVLPRIRASTFQNGGTLP